MLIIRDGIFPSHTKNNSEINGYDLINYKLSYFLSLFTHAHKDIECAVIELYVVLYS